MTFSKRWSNNAWVFHTRLRMPGDFVNILKCFWSWMQTCHVGFERFSSQNSLTIATLSLPSKMAWNPSKLLFFWVWVDDSRTSWSLFGTQCVDQHRIPTLFMPEFTPWDYNESRFILEKKKLCILIERIGFVYISQSIYENRLNLHLVSRALQDVRKASRHT